MQRILVDIWHGKLGLSPTGPDYFLTFLDQGELAHANQLDNQTVRSRFIEARAWLRIILGHYLNQPANSILLSKTEHGKPYLPDFPELAFNLSHTANYLALAVTQKGEVGLDIEQIRPRKNLTGLAEKCFAINEMNHWRLLPERDRLSAFFRFWTAKEAFVKATGRGIGLGLNQCAINTKTWAGFEAVPEAYRPASDWLLHSFDLAENVSGAIVSNSARLAEAVDVNITYRSLLTL